ncbi:MAG TPA: HIT domain-containing protein [Bacteroidota bacterium]|nr:HIT domain-containing protein [Bacteroidota bacterium]
MERMWSPWRSQYISSFNKPARRTRKNTSLFAAALKSGDDDRHLIVWRGKLCFVIMNRYPYNSGHLMVVPNRQTADIQDLTVDELADIMQTVQRSIRALDEVMHPQGYNLGANLGKVGGAGVDNHIHFHIVPRWNGDTNFMPVLSDTKVISEDMVATLKKLRKSFKNDPL